MFQSPITPTRHDVRLFCIPHAGGGPSAFRGWRDRLRPDVETTIIELPGREGRFRERPHERLGPLVQELTAAIIPYVDEGQRFAFFGNSLGGLIAFETLHEIRRFTGHEAEHFFVSAASAPHFPSLVAPMGDLGDAELIQKLAEHYGGIPAALLADPGFMEAVLPIIRADLGILETYKRRSPDPLRCPLTAIGGKRDRSVSEEQIAGWGAQTTSSFRQIMLDEGHLYLQSSLATLTACIRETLGASPATAQSQRILYGD